MAFDFPSSPTNGQKYPASPIAGIPTYTWDGEKWTTSGASIGQYVAKAGDTMTGDLTIAKTAPRIVLNATGTNDDANIVGRKAGLRRWVFSLGNTSPEAGGNLGSDFAITRYSDVDVSLDTPILINRSTGQVILSADPTAPLGVATKQYVDAVALAPMGMQVNGGMEVDQPNAGAVIPLVNGTNNLIDGYKFYRTGTSVVNAQQVASTIPGYSKSLKFTCTTAQPTIGSDSLSIILNIEGYRTAWSGWGTSAARPVTVGFWVKSSVTGSVTGQINNFDASNVAGQFIPANPIAAPNVAQWCTIGFAAQTTGVWKRDNGLGLGVTLNIGTQYLNIASAANNTFEITGLVVLPGALTITAAQSPLLMRSYDQELAVCRRYYSRLGGQIAQDIQLTGYANSAGVGISSLLSLGTTMRAAPTASQFGTFNNSNLSATNFFTTNSTLHWQIVSTATGTVQSYSNIGGIILDARL